MIRNNWRKLTLFLLRSSPTVAARNLPASLSSTHCYEGKRIIRKLRLTDPVLPLQFSPYSAN